MNRDPTDPVAGADAAARPLTGRSALITGASRGLGLAIAQAYVAAGADVLICARAAPELDRARAELEAAAGPDQRVVARTADIADIEQVSALMSAALECFPDLTALVNNAGIWGPKGAIEKVDWKEWIRAIEINLLGSVLMARAIVPHFKQVGYGKIVQLSGGGATSPLPFISAYAASKAAIVRFAETLAGELQEHRVDVNAVAPGAVNTRMLDEVLAAGPEQVGAGYYARALEQQRSGGAAPERAAELAVWLASAASDGITGKLISAVWDPWRELPAHRDELDSDLYTLRRIVPADRGLAWGD